jgi:hypothetical protein
VRRRGLLPAVGQTLLDGLVIRRVPMRGFQVSKHRRASLRAPVGRAPRARRSEPTDASLGHWSFSEASPYSVGNGHCMDRSPNCAGLLREDAISQPKSLLTS